MSMRAAQEEKGVLLFTATANCVEKIETKFLDFKAVTIITTMLLWILLSPHQRDIIPK